MNKALGKFNIGAIEVSGIFDASLIKKTPSSQGNVCNTFPNPKLSSFVKVVSSNDFVLSAVRLAVAWRCYQ